MNYRVVVESGSHSEDGKRWEEKAWCGHNHKSMAAAEKCMEKSTRWYCQHGIVAGRPCGQCLGYAQRQQTNAKWWGATIHDEDNRRVA